MTESKTAAASLRLERDGDIAFIIADNAARMNAFTAAMWEALPTCIAEAERDGAIRVIFDDTGCGMTTEEMRRLFDPFHSTKDNERHLGLGLFVSHEIVRQHGGDLLVESQPGVGSTVTVVLPMERLPLVSEEELV